MAGGGEGGGVGVVEFYSGIGGMRYSLSKSGVKAHIIQAFDINNTANDVYHHNFAHRPSHSNLQTLTPSHLDLYAPHAWLLSPPCQPYTTQGLRRHSSDPRSSSLLHLLRLLPLLRRPPLLLLLENVLGFHSSDTHRLMLHTLAASGFSSQEFILSPSHFRLPYSRPRYFCLARRTPPPPLPSPFFSPPNPDSMADSCHPLEDYLEAGVVGEQHSVPLQALERWGPAMDVVRPDSKRCCCFTKSYCRYFKGTGSVLCCDDEHVEGSRRIRYFTPREVANLHSFPPEFDFPPHISLRQRYALLGNSLSVAVVAPLITHLFSSTPPADDDI